MIIFIPNIHCVLIVVGLPYAVTYDLFSRFDTIQGIATLELSSYLLEIPNDAYPRLS